MSYVQHIYVEGGYLGNIPRKKLFIHGELHEPQHYAYFCPSCGNLWARLPVDGTVTENWWRIVGGYCRKHPERSNPFSVAGSLMLGWEPEYCELLLSCPDVVKWEMARHLEFIERKIAND